MLRALLWKQWREYRWILLACTIALIVFAWAAPLLSEENFITILAIPSLLLPCFVAAQVVAGERAAGTNRLLATLPVRRLYLSAIQVISGLLILALPMLAAIALALFRSSSVWDVSPVGYKMLQSCAFMISSTVMTYLWILNIAARFKSRGSVATAGAAILFFAFVTFNIVEGVFYHNDDRHRYLLYWLGPCYFRGQSDGRFDEHYVMVGRVIASVVLLSTSILRLAMPARVDSVIPNIRRPARLLGPSRISIGLVWLFWKSFREILWLAFFAILIDVAAASLLAFMIWTRYGTTDLVLEIFLADSVQVAVIFWFIIGSILMIALAIRLTGPDRQPAMENFWRSRPIRPAALFWTKFLTGALVPIVVFIAILVLLSLISQIRWLRTKGLSDGALVMAAVQLCTYAFAVFVGTILRNSFITALIGCVGATTLFIPILLSSAPFEDPAWVASSWQTLLLLTALITLLTAFTWSTHLPLPSPPQKT